MEMVLLFCGLKNSLKCKKEDTIPTAIKDGDDQVERISVQKEENRREGV